MPALVTFARNALQNQKPFNEVLYDFYGQFRKKYKDHSDYTIKFLAADESFIFRSFLIEYPDLND